MNDFDRYCLECNSTLPINSDPKKEYCDDCKYARKLDREHQKYYKRKLNTTYHVWKVLLIQSPYFAEKRRIEKPVMV